MTPAPGQSVPHMCWLDKASPRDGPLCFCNVGGDAAWRLTYRTHQDYLNECEAKSKSPADLMLVKTLRLEGFLPDAMHGMDEGFAADVCGNIMWEVMQTPGWGSTQQKRAETLDSELRKHYKTVKVVGCG